jgi:hypothetical protein
LLLQVDTGAVPDLNFDNGVLGRVERQGRKAGVAFTKKDDSPFSSVADLGSEGPTPKVIKQTCYDRAGRVLSGDLVSLR